MTFVFLLICAVVLGLMAYVRFTPVTDQSGVGRPAVQGAGDYPALGGHYAVRAFSGTAEDMLARVQSTVLADPRSRVLSGDPASGGLVFETRSLAWAFPDIVHVWAEDGHLHISAHLVYGRSDFGANRKRVLAWLESLEPL